MSSEELVELMERDFAVAAAPGGPAEWFCDAYERNDYDNEPASRPLPAGTYEILAWFDGPDPVSAGRVTLVAGEKVMIRCVSAMARCR